MFILSLEWTEGKRGGRNLRTGAVEGTAAGARLNGERMYSVLNATLVGERSKSGARKAYEPRWGEIRSH